MRTLTALLCLGLVALPAPAQEANPAQTIAPLVDDLTVMIFRYDLSRVDVATVMDRLKELKLFKEEDLAKARPLLAEGLASFRKAGGQAVFLVQRLIPGAAEPCLVVPLAAGADADALKKLAREIFKGIPCEIHGKFLLAGPPPSIEGLKEVRPVGRPEMAKAFAATGGGVIQGVWILSDTFRRTALENFPPNLPKELGGGDLKEMLNGFAWAAVRGSLTPRWSIEDIVQAKDPAAAKKFKELGENAVQALAKRQEVKDLFPNIDKLTSLFKPKVQGARLTLAADATGLSLTFVPAVQKVRQAAARTQSINNLKQLALAMHIYHDTYKTFPPFANHDKQGKPLLSWRVHVLPYLEQEELYKQFRLDEPWDSEHNKKLIPKMPKLYLSPLQKVGDGKTCYLVPLGKDTIFWGSEGRKFQDITDGLSNTLMVLEANDDSAVIWTKPEDFPAGAKDALQRILRPKAEGFLAAFADGSVRTLPPTLALETLRALFIRNDGKVVDLP